MNKEELELLVEKQAKIINNFREGMQDALDELVDVADNIFAWDMRKNGVDAKDLITVHCLISDGEFKAAAKCASSMDTAAREYIPESIWKLIETHY